MSIDTAQGNPIVQTGLDDGVLRLTLNRPAQRNPLSRAMISSLHHALLAAADAAEVHVVVIAAEGPAFCAGHDLRELTAARNAPDGGVASFRETMGACSLLMEAISTHPRPVIAEIQGIATAAGCQLVAACDLAFAANTATFATPGVNIGLFCTTPSVPLVRTIGPKAAMQMLLTGEPISATHAVAIGLINEAVPPAQLRDRVADVARTIARKPATVCKLGKAAVRRHAGMPLHEAYQYASEIMVDNLLLQEALAGISHFLSRKSSKPSV